MNDIEHVWENILSREPDRIRSQWRTLTAEDQASIIEHLQRMVHEEGWLDVQRESARTALDVLDAHPGNE